MINVLLIVGISLVLMKTIKVCVSWLVVCWVLLKLTTQIVYAQKKRC